MRDVWVVWGKIVEGWGVRVGVGEVAGWELVILGIRFMVVSGGKVGWFVYCVGGSVMGSVDVSVSVSVWRQLRPWKSYILAISLLLFCRCLGICRLSLCLSRCYLA